MVSFSSHTYLSILVVSASSIPHRFPLSSVYSVLHRPPGVHFPHHIIVVKLLSGQLIRICKAIKHFEGASGDRTGVSKEQEDSDQMAVFWVLPSGQWSKISEHAAFMQKLSHAVTKDHGLDV